MKNQKKIMLLGGIHYLLPVIKAAHEQGYYVITADYLPDNIAHKYSDEYVNVSITDKEAVLKTAQEHKIDGIISFGVDPGVETAAYVQEQMDLPSMGPYESVHILQNKDLFRAFLRDNGFNVPEARGYSSVEEALKDTDWLCFPMIVKPTDSAGSKGVTRVDSIDQYEEAVRYAFTKSIKGHIIVEEFIELSGHQSGSDSFVLDGKLVFATFDDQHFDTSADNPYTPSAHTWPSTMPDDAQAYLISELQRLISLLGMRTSLYNIEVRVGKNGKPYIMEVSPRAGGNRLSELLSMATGQDLVIASINAALGNEVSISKAEYDGYWANIILHAPMSSIFEGVHIDEKMRQNVKDQLLYKHKGEHVSGFQAANEAVGSLFMRFETREEMEQAITHQSEWLTILVNSEE